LASHTVFLAYVLCNYTVTRTITLFRPVPYHSAGWAKKLNTTVSQHIVLHCVPMKLVLSDFSVTCVIPHKQIIFKLLLNIISTKYSMQIVIPRYLMPS